MPSRIRSIRAAVTTMPKRQFVIVTKDFSGLGWAKKLQEEGEAVTVAHCCEEEDPELKKMYAQVGEGWVPTMPLSKALDSLKTPTTYWIFSENNFPEEADTLRHKGQKVFGTSKFTDQLEHDRQFAVDLVEQCGLESPATHEFSTRDQGLKFLDANSEKAYVFKPDDSGGTNYSTFVPVRREDADANRETYSYLQHMKSEPGSFILQERIPDGTEVCVEVWFQEGKPILATVGLELKRKNTGDFGEMCGCGGDYITVVPLDTPLVDETIGRMFDYYKSIDYTGIADVNVIITDEGPKFLEVCNRLGYNAHVSLFLGLAIEGMGDILADWMDGKTDDMAGRFKPGWACSMTLFLDHPRPGLPVHVDEWDETQFYPFDGYVEEGQFLLTGYSDEVGIFVASGPTMEAACKAVYDKVEGEEAVSIPDSYHRTDIGETGYKNAPIARYQALVKRELL
jgi:phosphoribosylamine-glycine ligase